MRHDDPDVHEVRMGPPDLPAAPAQVIEALAPLITDRRRERIEAVVDGRTFDVVPVLDGVHDPHNASAILRSADAFGIQRIEVIPAPTGFKAARAVSKGAHRWLDVHHRASATDCHQALKADGYEIFVASMEGEHRPADLASRPKVAVVFGNEHAGVSSEMRALADGAFAIPMRGFVESLNVSVAAAVTLHALTSTERPGLDPEARSELMARYLMLTVRDAARVVTEYVAGPGGFK